MDEATLLRLSRRGDRTAFGELVARHQASVYRVVRGILRDPSESEDVTQEAFVKAWGSLGRFRGESGFFTWIYRIAVNESLMAARRRRPRPMPQVPEVEAPRESEAEGPSIGALEAMLQRLPDDQRAILVLRDLEGLTYQQIAETLEIPIGTVESRIFRARSELREMWRRAKLAADPK
jgi:RNA polymerase sigma-70 factor (ECF subfamily)